MNSREHDLLEALRLCRDEYTRLGLRFEALRDQIRTDPAVELLAEAAGLGEAMTAAMNRYREALEALSQFYIAHKSLLPPK